MGKLKLVSAQTAQVGDMKSRSNEDYLVLIEDDAEGGNVLSIYKLVEGCANMKFSEVRNILDEIEKRSQT